MANSATPTHSFTPNLRTVFYLVAVLIIFAVPFGGYKLIGSLSDNHDVSVQAQVSVDENQAKALETARQEREAQQKTMREQVTSLKSLQMDITSLQKTITGLENTEAAYCSSGAVACGLNADRIATDKRDMGDYITRYNDLATKAGKGTLTATNPPLPSSFDANGNPIP